MTAAFWRQLAPILEDSFLTLLAESLNPSIEEEETQVWSWREVFEVLRNGFLRFDGPCHVCVNHVGEQSTWYPAVVEARDIINEALQASPGSLLVPLCPDEVELAQRALDAGLLKVEESWGYKHIHHFCTNIRADWSVCDRRDSKCYSFPGLVGKPFDLHELAHAVDRAVECAIIQLGMPNSPPGVSKSLELVADLLVWHSSQYEEEEA